MQIKVEKMKELEDGSAIVWLEMSPEAKDFFIGEGFLAVLKRSIATSESYVKEKENVKPTSKKKTNRSKQQGKKGYNPKSNNQKNQ
jgi:hypothetical protein